MNYQNHTLDPFQEQAIRAIEAHRTVVVAAPTGAGKTVIAEYAVQQCLEAGRGVIYTAPIKALSNQKYRDFSARYVSQVGLLTGDVKLNPSAPVRIMTTEILRNMLLDDPRCVQGVDYIIFDEVHYINDIERGTVWEECIIFAPRAIEFICLSATIPNLGEFADWVAAVRHREIGVVLETERPVPLEHALYADLYGVGTLEEMRQIQQAKLAQRRPDSRDVASRNLMMKFDAPGLIEILRMEGKLPCLYFCQSRKRCENLAFDHIDSSFLKDAEAEEVARCYDALCLQYGVASNPTAALLREMVVRGVAYHHAGLLPQLKEIVEQLFVTGLIHLIFTTETFAVGLNMPACSVVFDSFEKYDGAGRRYLKAREYHQMAGRAGRRGIDTRGYVYTRIQPDELNFGMAERILHGPLEPIDSQFDLSYASILNLYDHYGERIYELLNKSFSHFQQREQLNTLAEALERLEAKATPPVACVHHRPEWIAQYQQLTELWVEEKQARKQRERALRRELRKEKQMLASYRRKYLMRQLGDEFAAKIDKLATQRERVVCHRCHKRAECTSRFQQLQKAERSQSTLLAQKAEIENVHVHTVERRLNFLRSLGYLKGGTLSNKGAIASRLHGYEIQTTELLFAGVLDGLNEVQLNTLVTAIVFDAREDTDDQATSKLGLGDAFNAIEQRICALQEQEQAGHSTLSTDGAF